MGLPGSWQLDRSCREVLERTLQRILELTGSGDVIIDGRALTFADHTSLLLLDRLVGKKASTAVLRTACPTVLRIAELIELPHLRVEAFE